MTVDHLFGTVWTDEHLDLVRDRRLMTIGVLAAQDKTDLLEIQFDSALERGELTVGAGPRGRGAPDALRRLALSTGLSGAGGDESSAAAPRPRPPTHPRTS